MLERYAYGFFSIGKIIEGTVATAQNLYCPADGIQNQDVLGAEFVQGLKDQLKPARDWCISVELFVSVRGIDRILELPPEKFKRDSLLPIFSELQRLFEYELDSVLFKYIPINRVDYYVNVSLFGSEVTDKFESASFDIEEAGKCFATGRNTACVMHLQRVVEIGLKSFGDYLGVMALIKSAQPSWQKVLDVTAKEIKDRTIAKSWTSHFEQMYVEGIQAFLVAVKTAWRNPSMHADAKYTEEVAEDIFNAIKGFMRHLATHLDESGKYTP